MDKMQLRLDQAQVDDIVNALSHWTLDLPAGDLNTRLGKLAAWLHWRSVKLWGEPAGAPAEVTPAVRNAIFCPLDGTAIDLTTDKCQDGHYLPF
jgi:hypothetical protein